MTIVFPEAVKALGNTSTVIAPVIANKTAPILAEVTGTGTVNGSCYFYTAPMATTTANKGSAPRRSCETKDREQFGLEKTEISDLQYVESPQGAAADPANKVKVALAPYTEVWLVERRGLPATVEELAVGDIVNLHLVQVGPQSRTKTGDGEFDEFSITQSVIWKDSVYDVAIVAA